MAENKLPKGISTLRGIATKGGKGGSYLREFRRSGMDTGAMGFRAISETYSDRGRALRDSTRYRTTLSKLRPITNYRPVTAAPPTPRISDADLFRASRVRGIDKKAGTLARKAGKLGGKLGVLSLPSQYLEFREMMKKPRLHEREQKAAARSM